MKEATDAVVIENLGTDVRCDKCGAICDTIHIRRLEHEDATMFVCRDCCESQMMKLLDKED